MGLIVDVRWRYSHEEHIHENHSMGYGRTRSIPVWVLEVKRGELVDGKIVSGAWEELLRPLPEHRHGRDGPSGNSGNPGGLLA